MSPGPINAPGHVSRVTVVKQSTRSRVTCHLGEVVDPCELQQRGHAVEEAAHDEPVQRGGVVHLQYSTVQCRVEYSAVQYKLHLGQAGPAVEGDGGQGEDGRDA